MNDDNSKTRFEFETKPSFKRWLEDDLRGQVVSETFYERFLKNKADVARQNINSLEETIKLVKQRIDALNNRQNRVKDILDAKICLRDVSLLEAESLLIEKHIKDEYGSLTEYSHELRAERLELDRLEKLTEKIKKIGENKNG